jgi:hypothetical protein
MMQFPKRPEIAKISVCNADLNFHGGGAVIVLFSPYKKVKAPT